VLTQFEICGTLLLAFDSLRLLPLVPAQPLPAMKADEGAADESTPLLPNNATASTLGDVWLLSRLKGPVKKGDVEEQDEKKSAGISPNQYRPLTFYHFKLSCRLACLSVPFFFKLLIRTHKVALILAFSASILSGLFPTIGAWSSAKLLVEVQHSLTTGDVRLGNIELYAGITIGLALFRLVFQFCEEHSKNLLNRELKRLARSMSPLGYQTVAYPF
jgi:hypothetical protein